MAALWFETATASGLLGYALWVGLAPRRRLTRLGAILPACSCAAWAIFLVFGEPSSQFPPARTVFSDGSIELAVGNGLATVRAHRAPRQASARQGSAAG